jgi:hypothetical protein
VLFYRYRLKNDIGINHLFIEKDEITLTREWYRTQVPLLETQQKSMIEAQWSNTETFEPETYHDLWTINPETYTPETISTVTEIIPEVHDFTPPLMQDRTQNINSLLDRFIKKPLEETTILLDIKDELPE